jgi:hypothetical protein
MQWPMASFQAVNALMAAVLVFSTDVCTDTFASGVGGKPLIQVKPAASWRAMFEEQSYGPAIASPPI